MDAPTCLQLVLRDGLTGISVRKRCREHSIPCTHLKVFQETRRGADIHGTNKVPKIGSFGDFGLVCLPVTRDHSFSCRKVWQSSDFGQSDILAEVFVRNSGSAPFHGEALDGDFRAFSIAGENHVRTFSTRKQNHLPKISASNFTTKVPWVVAVGPSNS